MAIYGYARVSTTDQDLEIQREALKAADCKVIREEKKPRPAAPVAKNLVPCWSLSAKVMCSW